MLALELLERRVAGVEVLAVIGGDDGFEGRRGLERRALLIGLVPAPPEEQRAAQYEAADERERIAPQPGLEGLPLFTFRQEIHAVSILFRCEHAAQQTGELRQRAFALCRFAAQSLDRGEPCLQPAWRRLQPQRNRTL